MKPQPLKVWSKPGSNGEHFTLAAEIVLRSYLSSHLRGLTNTSHVGLTPHSLQSLHIWSEWGKKEERFTLDAETAFRPYLTSFYSKVTLISQSAASVFI
jgi:hypothetical protein